MTLDNSPKNYYMVLKFSLEEASVIKELAKKLGQPSADVVLIAVRQRLAEEKSREKA